MKINKLTSLFELPGYLALLRKIFPETDQIANSIGKFKFNNFSWIRIQPFHPNDLIFLFLAKYAWCTMSTKNDLQCTLFNLRI